MADGDAQAPQPDRQRGVGTDRVIALGTAVVDQHPIGQPLPLEGRDQVDAHGGGALVGTGDQAEGAARVVVQDGHRMAAAGARGPAGLEVHLPQGDGTGMLEALPSAGRTDAASTRLTDLVRHRTAVELIGHFWARGHLDVPI